MGLKDQKKPIDLVKELVSVSNSKPMVVSENGIVVSDDTTIAYHKDKDDKGCMPLVKHLDTPSKDMCGTDSQQTSVNNNIPDVDYNMDLGNSSEVRQQPVPEYGYTQDDMPIKIEANTSTDIGSTINVFDDHNTVENNTVVGNSSEVAQQQTYMPQGNAQPQYSNQKNSKNNIYKNCEIIMFHGQLQYYRTDKNGNIIDGCTLCQNPFSEICKLVDYTKNKALNYIVIRYNNNYTEPSIIKEKDLSEPKLIDILQAGLMINMSNVDIPKTKFASAMAIFLQSMANQNEEKHLYPNAGWILNKKKFYTLYIENDDALALKLQKMYPKLPVFKKNLKHDNLVLKTPYFKDSKRYIYQLAFYGSILMTLLQENRVDTGFAIWMPNNSKSRKFVDVFFRIWENHQAQIDISQKVQLKNIITLKLQNSYSNRILQCYIEV